MIAPGLLPAWRELLGRYAFTHFATYTFRFEPSPDQARKELYRYVHRVNRGLFSRRWYRHPEQALCFASALEGLHEGQRPHIHALIALPSRPVPPSWQGYCRSQWRSGHSQLKVVTGGSRAVDYLLKERRLEWLEISAPAPR
jgi:hypothetical protein